MPHPLIVLVHNEDDGTFTEADTDAVIWVRDGYTEPRELLFCCVACQTLITDWFFMTCMDGGDAAHITCVEFRGCA